MARPQVRDITPANPIRPQAAPVDSYVRPADPASSPLHGLAQGLAAFDTGLSAWLKERQQGKVEADAIRGAAEFNRNNQKEWAEAVEQGLVPAHASPIFMEGYKKAQGNLAGIRLREKFNSEYVSWEHRNAGDPELFQEFLSTFISTNVTTDDPEILAGLMPHVEALTDTAYSTYGTDLARTAYDGSVNTRAAIIGDTIDHASIQGLVSEEGTDYAALMSDILAQREEALASGIRMADYDAQLVDAIAAKAIEHGDPLLLDLLDETIPGYDVALSSLPDFRDVKARSISTLETRARQRMLDADRQQQKEDEENHDRIVRWVVGSLAEDPMQEIPEDVLKAWEKYDPEARTKALSIRRQLLDGQQHEDPDALLYIERMVQEGATVSDMLDLAADGTIADVSTLRTAIDRVERRQASIREGHGILGTQTTRRYLATIRERLEASDLTRIWAPDGLTDEAIEATRDFEEMLLEWELNNPNATLMEREQKIHDAAELILKRIVDREDGSDREYISPQDAEEMRSREDGETQLGLPASETDAEVAPGVRAGEAVGARADQARENAGFDSHTVQTFGQDAPPNLNALDEADRYAVTQEAAGRGITPDDYIMQIWKFVREQMGLPAEAPSPAPGGDTSQAPTSPPSGHRLSQLTFSPEPTIQAASPLLDLIGDTEGTDRGRGYNETLAYGLLTGGDRDLVNMTLAEIDQLQTQMLRHPQNRWNSSALGRYQIIRTTLRDIKGQMGLTDDMKFTPELQDRMAMHLLNRRGYDRWQAGTMSDQAFQNQLSLEWASLPTTSNTGSYQGQRIGTDTSGVMSAFSAIRNPGPGIMETNPALAAIGDATAADRAVQTYSNIPQRELDQFLQWNSDPIGNHEENLNSIHPRLADVVRRAEEIAGVRFVVGSGKRDEDLQRKAVEWGWSRTMNSDHLDGSAVDLWPLDANDAVNFDRASQLEIVRAMRRAAQDLGVQLDIGADWSSFEDLPHFGIKLS